MMRVRVPPTHPPPTLPEKGASVTDPNGAASPAAATAATGKRRPNGPQWTVKGTVKIYGNSLIRDTSDKETQPTLAQGSQGKGESIDGLTHSRSRHAALKKIWLPNYAAALRSILPNSGTQPFLLPRGRRRAAPRTSRLRRRPAAAQRANLIHSVLEHSRARPFNALAQRSSTAAGSAARREKKIRIPRAAILPMLCPFFFLHEEDQDAALTTPAKGI